RATAPPDREERRRPHEQTGRATQRHARRLRRSATTSALNARTAAGATQAVQKIPRASGAASAGGEEGPGEGGEGPRDAGPPSRRRERILCARGHFRGDEEEVTVAEDGEVQVGGEVRV